MALIDLRAENIEVAFLNGHLDADYAARLREVLRELINNRGWGGPVINDKKSEPCADCSFRVYFNSPRPGNYQDWVWIQVMTNKGCNVWIHLVALENGDWSWSVWSDRPFRGSYLTDYNMPPNFTQGPVYKTHNRPGDLTTIFDEICNDMQALCDCAWF
jgi:hypothetical protein